ncbi:MAG: class I SAM-dependent DNA methyltransferase [Candidatus Binataceae bacterium]
MSSFDLVANRFEHHRALPSQVPLAIRQALETHGGIDQSAPLLEVGCGTGRIGAQLNSACDNYFGLDLSIEMLREFDRKKLARKPNLVQADGCLLPFRARIFAGVLLMHVRAAGNWPAVLAEAQRVLRREGVLAMGKTQAPPDGIDATMRNRLGELITGMGIAEPLPDRDAAGEWLRAKSSRHLEIRPARWTLDRSPREFISRKQTGARFASLPADLRATVLRSLADWAAQTIGPLDTPFSETHYFSLELYWF